MEYEAAGAASKSLLSRGIRHFYLRPWAPGADELWYCFGCFSESTRSVTRINPERERKRERERNLPASATLSRCFLYLPTGWAADRGKRGQTEVYTFISSSGNAQLAYLLWSSDCFISSPTFRTLYAQSGSWFHGVPSSLPLALFFPSVLSSSLPPFSFVSVFSGSLLVAAERIFLCAPLERLDRGFHGNLEIVTRQARPPLQRATSRWIAEIFRSTFIEWKNLYQLCCSSYVSRLRIKFKAEISCPFPLELVWNVCCVNRIMPFDHLHRYFHVHKYPSEGSEETLYNKDMDHKKENKKKTIALLVKWQSFFVHRLDLPIC